jgi:lipopolysaccharide biosynthesis glycosyltransferase
MRTVITLVTDQLGYELARHAVVSILMSQNYKYDLIVFCHRFEPPKDAALFSYAASRGIELEMAPIEDESSESFTTHGHITTATLLKFEAVDRLYQKYDRVLYADIDILFFDNIAIDKVDFRNKPLAAVVDVGEWVVKSHARESAGFEPYGEEYDPVDYFNAGLLLFNCAMWDSKSFRDRYVHFLTVHDAECVYKKDCLTIDQCALNRLFEGQWTKLPAGYNFQACGKFTRQWKSAEVRHYTGAKKFLPMRPWRNDNRDTRYIRKIRHVLGYTNPVPIPFVNYVFELNARRHRPEAMRVESILGQIESRMNQAR